MVGGAPESGCPQRLGAQSELQLSPASPETLQDQQLGLTEVLFKLLLLPRVLEHVRFCMGPLTVESGVLTTLWFSPK